MSSRGWCVFVLSTLLTGCAATQIEIRGDIESPNTEGRILRSIRGRLSAGRAQKDARVAIDPRFEAEGFAAKTAPLVVVAGDQSVLIITDDDGHATLFVAIPSEHVAPRTTVPDGDFIPYLALDVVVEGAKGEARSVRAVCKGGRGRLELGEVDGATIAGAIAIRLSCRTYVDGEEREESELTLSGAFRAAWINPG